MLKLDIKRIKDRHDKFSRSIKLDSKDERCTQSIFIDRYFSFLMNRAFKLKIDNKIHYALFLKSKSIVNFKFEYLSYGVRKHLGYNDSEFSLLFINERGKSVYMEGIHYNEFLQLEYEEITLVEYAKIVNLFTC